MKRFCIACVGFSMLCLAFSCGQQALKRDAQAAQASGGPVFVHAKCLRFDPNGTEPSGSKGLLNLSHVTFIGEDNIAFVATVDVRTPQTYQIDAADVPK
jgi:hypothetical protein